MNLKRIYNFPSTYLNNDVDDCLDILYSYRENGPDATDEQVLDATLVIWLSALHAMGGLKGNPTKIVAAFKDSVNRLMADEERIIEP